MKTAIICYSFTGNCAKIAGELKALTQGDVFEIKTVDKKKRSGLALYAWGGYQVLFHKHPAIAPLSIDMNSYDMVILGTPVWAGSPAPAMGSFLKSAKISGKKLALFCCHGGGKGKVFDKLKALVPGNSFTGEIDFKGPSGDDGSELKKKIEEWVKTLV